VRPEQNLDVDDVDKSRIGLFVGRSDVEWQWDNRHRTIEALLTDIILQFLNKPFKVLGKSKKLKSLDCL